MAEENSLQSPKLSMDDKEALDDSGITMQEVLEHEESLESCADAVLGASDDQNCTYPSGYIKRQALYACGTCTAKSQSLAGICLACSYACHEGHRLFELYTKRNFCCDCGNSKFSSNPCKLFTNKDEFNNKNQYNQNFRGTYCSCSRPYPDPDDDIEDEMIQCITCEDWYHGRHIGTPVPSNNEYEEMICGHCMCKYDFLWPYTTLTSGPSKIVADLKDENGDVNVEETDEQKPEVLDGAGSGVETSTSLPLKMQSSIKDEKKEEGDSTGNETESCFLEQIANNIVKSPGSAMYWPDGWRNRLCRCQKCKTKYSEHNVSFLLDDEDTVHSYEEQGKAKNSGQSQYDQGIAALSQLDRIKQVEAISEYNDMKVELKDFLKNFAENKKVVQKEDIDEFFTQMRQRKRQRLEVSVPNFCR